MNRLGETVNSVEGQEFVPVISADGKTLLFCGKHRNDSVGGEDIYISRHTAEGWSPAEPLRELCTKEGNEAPLSLSADGMKMILFKNGKLYMSVKGVEGWKEPELLSDAINISPWQADAMITSDGKALLFAAKKQTSHEWGLSVNIFVSLLNEKGEWSEPIDLGPKINTPLMDRSPVLHPDMKTLYFSSEGHHSSGDLDVFVSTRLREDSWTEWSEPVNLGKSINTEGRECW